MTSFHFQVLSRPGTCHYKNQVLFRMRKSPVTYVWFEVGVVLEIFGVHSHDGGATG